MKTEILPNTSSQATPPQQENKVANRLRLLLELSTHLQGLMDSEHFYDEMVEIIQRQFNYYSAQLWTVGQDHSAHLRAQSGAYRTHLNIGQTLKAPVPGITGYVIQTKKPYLTNNVSEDPNFTNLSLPVFSKSQVSVPVIFENEVIGVLNIESDEEGAFDQDDIVTLEAVSSQLSIILKNQKLYSDAKDFNRMLQKAVAEKTEALQAANEKIVQQQKLTQKENKTLKTLVHQEQQKNIDIIGKSRSIESVLSMVEKIAPTNATVLIEGESGTGKELIARRLHFKSDRNEMAYVVVNCGTLNENLLESELFGHEKGSFTGATSQKIGLAETADGGTLFLDEIGEMSMGIQAKLLRFLQEGEFYRIGGKKPLKVDVRVVSATNRNLEEEVRGSRFREDLYYRLNTITMRMPPLRKRLEDIPLLVDFFLKNSRFGGAAQEIKHIDPRVVEAFQKYDWPGNIRELQNTIERLKILADNQEIRLEDIPFSIRMPKNRTETNNFSVSMPMEEVEKNHILRALAFHHGNKTKTAQSLGITIKTLYNKLHKYGAIQTGADKSGSNPSV